MDVFITATGRMEKEKGGKFEDPTRQECGALFGRKREGSEKEAYPSLS